MIYPHIPNDVAAFSRLQFFLKCLWHFLLLDSIGTLPGDMVRLCSNMEAEAVFHFVPHPVESLPHGAAAIFVTSRVGKAMDSLECALRYM